jgi:hypothetical protein
MPRNPIEAYPDASVLDLVVSPTRKTMVSIGDSWLQYDWSTIPTENPTFYALNAEGHTIWANALAGAPLHYIANLARGGKTIQNALDEQLLPLMQLRPGVANISGGHNDIYNEGVTGAVAFERMKRLVSELLNAGILPMWSTIFARPFGSTATLREHLKFNDLAKRWDAVDDVGLLFDLHAATARHDGTQGEEVSGYYHTDGPAPYIHPGNLGAYRVGKKRAAQWRRFFTERAFLIVGQEDGANTASQGNLLSNVIFAGTGGTAGAGVTGSVPTGFTVDWGVRTGSGSAAVAVVNIPDPDDAGKSMARALQVTLSGNAAANDELRIGQLSGFNTALSGGDIVTGESVFDLASPANVSRIRSRIQTNATESTWWGATQYPLAALPDAMTGVVMPLRPMPVSGSGVASAALMEVRILFNGAGTGTVFRWYLPRCGKNR